MPLTAPTLAILDNADGTGVTISLTGGDAAATNTVYRFKFEGVTEVPRWLSTYTRTGDGSSVVGLANGVYWFHCLSVKAGESVVSNLVYRIVTDGRKSVYILCKNAIVTRIKELNLAEICQSVYSVPLPEDRSKSYPCCVVTAQPTPPSIQSATNLRDERGYAVAVLFMTSSDRGPSMPEETITLWRQRAERAFSGQRLEVAEVRRTEVEPAMVLDPNEPAYNKVVSAFTVRCYCWEERGMGA